MSECHIHLRVDGVHPGTEPVHAESLGGTRYRVLYSPGLVYGIAAGDEVEIDEIGGFSLLRRGGNLAIRVLSPSRVGQFADHLINDVATNLDGRLDGKLKNALAFTVPVKIGFEKIETVFRTLTESYKDAIWEYGNVYDEAGKAIGWWEHEV